MKRQKTLVILMAFMGMLLGSAMAYAGASVTASYAVVAVQATASGSLISLDMTVTNNGTVDLNATVVNEIDPTQMGGDSNSLNVGALAIGAQAVRQWTIASSTPADQLSTPLSLFFNGNAVDGNGNPVAVAVEGVAR